MTVCEKCGKPFKRMVTKGSFAYSWLGHHHASKCKNKLVADYKRTMWGCWLKIGSPYKFEDIEAYMIANKYIDKENRYRLPND